MKTAKQSAGSIKLSKCEPGQIVRGIDLSAFRVTSKVAGPEGAVVKVANLNGEPVSLPTDFTPVGFRMAHLASAMFLHLAYNKDFDLYVRAYCEQAGLPIPVGPDNQPFRWANWLQSKIAPKLIVPQKGDDAESLKDEAIHEMLFNELGHRNVLSKFRSAIKRNFAPNIKKMSVDRQLAIYLCKIFSFRIEEMNRKLKNSQPGEEVAMEQGTQDNEDEDFNIVETEQYSEVPREFETAEAAHDIQKFRAGFYEWLKQHQTEKSAQSFITLFDIYWEWISESSETEDQETGRPAFMPARRNLEPLWQQKTNLSNASLYDYVGRLAKMLEQYITENRHSLGEGNLFVKLIDGIHQQREDLRKKTKKKSRMPVAASLDALSIAASEEHFCNGCQKYESECTCEDCKCGNPNHGKTAAKLIRGDELTPEMKAQIFNAFPYRWRWTRDNPQRTKVYRCSNCDINNPFTGGSAEGHTHPTVPLQTDEQWLNDHAFHFTNAGALMPRRSAEPAFLAGERNVLAPVASDKTAAPNYMDEVDTSFLPGHDDTVLKLQRCKACDAQQHNECAFNGDRGTQTGQRCSCGCFWSKPKYKHADGPIEGMNSQDFDEAKNSLQPNVEEELIGERMDREHPVCPRCLECTECNLRPCRGGSEHMPGVERSEAWRMNKEMAQQGKLGSQKTSHESLPEAVANILEAQADGVVTEQDWNLLEEAVDLEPGASTLITVSQSLLDAQRHQNVTSQEWDAVKNTLAEETGRSIDWHHADKLATEPLQQLRPTITPGDTGRLPHARKEGGEGEELDITDVVDEGEVRIRFRDKEEVFSGDIQDAIKQVETLSKSNPNEPVVFIIDEGGIISEDTWVNGDWLEDTKEIDKTADDAAAADPTTDTTSTTPQQMVTQNITDAQGNVDEKTEQVQESEAGRNKFPVNWNMNSQFAVPQSRMGATAVTPQQMAVTNVEKSQGQVPSAAQNNIPAQSTAPTGPPVAIPLESGSGNEEQQRERKTVPPELPDQNFHMSSEELVDRKRFFAAVRKKQAGHFYDTIVGVGKNKEAAYADAVFLFHADNQEYADEDGTPRYDIREVVKERMIEKVPPKHEKVTMQHGTKYIEYVDNPAAPKNEWLEKWEFEIHSHA